MSVTTLTRLDTAQEARAPRPVWREPRHLIRGIVPIGAIVVWHLVSLANPDAVIPSPTIVSEGFIELWEAGDVQAAIPVSLARALTGLGIGLAIGLLAGVFNGLFRIGEELFDSTFQILRVVPFIAVVPLFIVWFGIDEQFKIVLISMACAFPAYLNAYAAVRNVDDKLTEAATVFGLSRLGTIRRVIVPGALPGILVGVRYSMGIALLALIVAEQVNSKAGIGYIIFSASSALRIDLIIVGILIYAALGVVVDVVMRIIEAKALPWK